MHLQLDSFNEETPRSMAFFNDNSYSRNPHDHDRNNTHFGVYFNEELSLEHPQHDHTSPLNYSFLDDNSIRFTQAIFKSPGGVEERPQRGLAKQGFSNIDSPGSLFPDEKRQESSTRDHQEDMEILKIEEVDEETPQFNHRHVSNKKVESILPQRQHQQMVRSTPQPSNIPTSKLTKIKIGGGTKVKADSRTEAESSKAGKHSLKNLTEQVEKVIRAKKSATYNQITQIILDNMNSEVELEPKEQKNIKRRIYDALNVMVAIGYTKKEGKQLTFVEAVRATEPSQNKAKLHALAEAKALVQQAAEHVKDKEVVLQYLRNKHQILSKLVERNMTHPSPEEFRFQSPVLFIKTSGSEGEGLFFKSSNSLLVQGERVECVSELDLLMKAPNTLLDP